jgi:hypothetical protein
VGSAVSVAALFAVGVFVLRKRNRRLTAKVARNEAGEKPMLHSDHVKPDRKELPGDELVAKYTPWNASTAELPVNETVGAELDASTRISQR